VRLRLMPRRFIDAARHLRARGDGVS